MSSDGFFEDIDETDLAKFEPIESLNQDLENFDAFNEETFDAALEGDWEAEHDKLLLLENINETESENGFNGTLTKFTDFEENKDQKVNDYEEINDNIELKQSRNNQFGYSDTNNSRFENAACLQNFQINQESKQNLGQFNEAQFKLMQQLQLQQQQQLQQQIFQQHQFQKNQLMQQQQKQFQLASLSQQLTQEQRMQLEKLNLQQLNPAMLAAAIIARNNQMQNNLLNNQQQFMNTSVQMNNNNNDLNRKTPISFINTNNNNNFNGNMLNMMQHQMQPTNNEITLSNKENTYYSTNNINPINNNLNNQQSLLNYSGNQLKISSYQPNESDSVKLKNLLEKINTNELNSNTNVTSQTHGASNSSKAPVDNMLMLAMLHQQSNQALPKLPPVKVCDVGFIVSNSNYNKNMFCL